MYAAGLSGVLAGGSGRSLRINIGFVGSTVLPLPPWEIRWMLIFCLNYLAKHGSLLGFHNCFPVGQCVDHCSRMGPGWFGTNLVGLCWTVPGVAILAAAIWELISGLGRSYLAPPSATGVDFTAVSSSQCAQEFYSAIP